MRDYRISETLERAKELIKDYDKWTVGALARYRPDDYDSVSYIIPAANCFCAVGATMRAEHDAGFGEAYASVAHLTRTAMNRFATNVTELNDVGPRTHFRHALVLSLFDSAIDSARVAGL